MLFVSTFKYQNLKTILSTYNNMFFVSFFQTLEPTGLVFFVVVAEDRDNFYYYMMSTDFAFRSNLF